MALRVDGGRGTTGRLSPFKAFVVDALAVVLIVIYALVVLATIVGIVGWMTR